jgi:ring-1,2-phenylacetyl-CoA epoxidase subunit PaaC
MNNKTDLIEYLLRLGDSALIQGQRLCQWCGKAPALEEELALMNVGLDLVGQARNWLDYAAELLDDGRDADDLAFRRDERAYRNLLLVEQPNGDYAVTILKQFLYDAWHLQVLNGLSQSSDERIAGIAAKAVKEVTYHLRRSGEWVDAWVTAPRKATNACWRRSRGLALHRRTDRADDSEQRLHAAGITPDTAQVAAAWQAKVTEIFASATLPVPAAPQPFLPQCARACTPNTWASCWPRCSSCHEPTPMQPGELIASDLGARPAQRRPGCCLGGPRRGHGPGSAGGQRGRPGHRARSRLAAGHLHLVVTPTYSGCPATEVIEGDIRQALEQAGFQRRSWSAG